MYTYIDMYLHTCVQTAEEMSDLCNTETANRADSGQLQFWSKPSEILNVRSKNPSKMVSVSEALRK